MMLASSSPLLLRFEVPSGPAVPRGEDSGLLLGFESWGRHPKVGWFANKARATELLLIRDKPALVSVRELRLV